jgi:hypothetical protein
MVSVVGVGVGDYEADVLGFCGFMSVLSSMRYCLGAADDFAPIWAALGFMPFGLFFDFMDGKVARWRHKSSLMGQELDSLADLVSRLPGLKTLLMSRFHLEWHRQHVRSHWVFEQLSTQCFSHFSCYAD